MDIILKLLAVLPEIISLLKKIYDAVKGSENKVEAKAKVVAMKEACHGIACPLDVKK